VAAVLQSGFGNGLGNLQDALSSFGAQNAIKLTLIFDSLTTVLLGLFIVALVRSRRERAAASSVGFRDVASHATR
jgi:hypothetical protein